MMKRHDYAVQENFFPRNIQAWFTENMPGPEGVSRFDSVFKHSEGDAGYDLYITEDKWIWPFRVTKVQTNAMIELPEGFFGRVVGRSGESSKGNVVIEGTIDCNYRGVVSVLMYRIGFLPKKLKARTRVAQMVVSPYAEVTWQWVPELRPSNRGANGWGHSGTH